MTGNGGGLTTPEQQASKGDRERTAFTAPAISLPKGGGAIRGIGEKFTTNPVTGTGSLTVPIPVSPGRSRFGPQLTLSYDSGSGNGPFGIGWSLSLPSITRKTDKGLPRYMDVEESDVFILSGAEDLVPVLNDDLSRFVDTTSAPGFTIHRYRPRVEGLFARIERWTASNGFDVYWRSISKDNITTWYGKTPESRIADPLDPTRIFSWLICSSYDDKGNAILYRYQEEDSRGVDQRLAHEANRNDQSRSANRYIKRIKYGNRTPNRDPTSWQALDPFSTTDSDWLFEIVFDYDEGHCADVPLDLSIPEASQHRYITCSAHATADWTVRPDPYSSARSTFEVRCYRRISRILSLHNFAELGVQPCLVRSTEFEYDDFDYSQPYAPAEEAAHPGSTRTGSIIRSITQSGYVHSPTLSEPLRYLKRSLPPLEFEYTRPIIDETVHEVMDTENLPAGVDGASFQWVDLDGEGLSGAFTAQAGDCFYKRNISALPQENADGTTTITGRFEPLQRLDTLPASIGVSGQRYQFLDLAGDGSVDLVEYDGPSPGFFDRTDQGGWDPHVTFKALPTIDWSDPNLRFVDITGDGLPDVVITEDEAFIWCQSLGQDGFAPAERVQQALDENDGPRLVFADGSESIFLADMSGDGLVDLVRIRNLEICYWSNTGYCTWGAKVTMDNPPWLAAPDQFDPKRLRLCDLDGSGTQDLVVLGAQSIDVYRNQCGNRWTDRESFTTFPRTTNLSTVSAVDLLGNGTACLVWSSPLDADTGHPMHYVDLMGGQKPHLLVMSRNNLGAETRVQYAPSTRFYLKDRADGRPWITKLPFPVQVVERVETYDWISKNRFITKYAYHHGFFDGVEREFRGFAMVEQWDTEQLTALTDSDVFPDVVNESSDSYVPPVVTRTWFHTGADLKADQISRQLASEYFGAPQPSDSNFDALWSAFEPTLLPDTVLPNGLSTDERREGCRALKGSMLRQEIYAEDGSIRAQYPYLVTEQNQTVVRLQPRGSNQHSVFFVHPREALTYHYERNYNDPRIEHALTLDVEPRYGFVRRSLSVAYGRTTGMSPLADADRAVQERTLITYTENDPTNAVDDTGTYPNDYRTPLLCEARTSEVAGLELDLASDRLSFDDLVANDFATLSGLSESNYEDLLDYSQPGKRLIERVQTVFRSDDLTILLPPGTLQPLGLPGETYKLAFTSGLAKQLFVDSGKVTQLELDAMMAGDGGYVHRQNDTNWWVPSGRIFYSSGVNDSAAAEESVARAHFYLPRRYRDPFGADAFVHHDSYDLLLRETRDALGNQVTVGERQYTLPSGATLPAKDGNDYRVLQPFLVMDPNRNRSTSAFDAFGLVVGTAVMGKPEDAPAQGDRIDGSFLADPTDSDIATLYNALDPRVPGLGLLSTASTRFVYDVGRFRTTRIANPAAPEKWEPTFAATIVRETHFNDQLPPWGLRIQTSFSYGDGFGTEIQRKALAEPGPVPQRDAQGKLLVDADGRPQMTLNSLSPRWVGSGWTVFNNKPQRKPVQQFEPFFSDTHHPDFDTRIGVSSVMFYDPIERVVATLRPNHTYEKVLFDAWEQATYDVNDTATPRNTETGDPRTDADIQPYVANYFSALTLTASAWQTWYQQRITGLKGAEEQIAAQQTEAHADTPTTVHLDVLGRPFLTAARNRVVCSDHPLDGTEEEVPTRVELDIEGNQRSVRDAIVQVGDTQGRIVMQNAYDMLSTKVYHLSMDAGARWTLNDAAGSPIHSWDSRGHHFSTIYDDLRRPVERYVKGTTADSDPRLQGPNLGKPVLVEVLEYGENLGSPEILNLRTRIHRHSDSAGVVTNSTVDPNTAVTAAYDFKGNLLRSTRQLVGDYKAIPNWSQATVLDGEVFLSSTRFDALNRPLQSLAPRSDAVGTTVNVTQPEFNEAGLLERVHVWLGRASEPASLLNPTFDPPSTVGVLDVDYDAKGQRTLIGYVTAAGTAVTTTYDYDPETFRLVHLRTTRTGSAFTGDHPGELQNLFYTYDPVGNITHIQDDAQQTIYFMNQIVEPSNDYTYDALYRLIQATGREHLGQTSDPIPHSYNDAGRVGILTATMARLFGPNVQNAMSRYCEKYVYDAVGNFVEMTHHPSCSAGRAWRRRYTYNETSLIENGSPGTALKTNNRLTSTGVGNNSLALEPYGHGPHGNMTTMPQLHVMEWDFKDQLLITQRQRVNSQDVDGIQRDGERTWYVCDAAGQRVRKVTELAAGSLKEERIYLAGVEIYRNQSGANYGLERETLHVMDDKQRIALVETRNNVNDGSSARITRYQLSSHSGSACLELDDAAQIVSYEEYSAYGSTTYQAVRSQTEAPKRYRFTAKERDEESGLYYYGARYYASWLGRWTSCDPAGVRDGTVLYEFVLSNPIARVDPGGAQSQSVLALGAYQLQIDIPGGKISLGAGQGAEYVRSTAQTSLPEARILLLKDMPSFSETWAALGDVKGKFSGIASGTLVQEALEGKLEGIHFDVRGVDLLRQGSHTGSELRSIIADLSLKEPSLDIHFLHESGLSTIRKGTTFVEGPPLPEALAQRLPSSFRSGTPAESNTGAMAEVVGASSTTSKVGLGAKVLGVASAILGVVGAFAGGLQVGHGLNQVAEGKVGEGAADIAGGIANLGLTIGTAAALKSGALVAEAGVAAGGLAAAASLAAGGAIAMAVEETKRAVRGEKTLAYEAATYYAGMVVEGQKEGGFRGLLKQAGGWTGGFFSTLIAVGQGYSP